MTTQNATLTYLTSVEVELTPMQPAEGSALIHKHLQQGESENEDAEKLSIKFGGHPLAIAHFASYLARPQGSFQLILLSPRDRGHSRGIWFDGSVASLCGYPRSLETVWDLALTRLSIDARELVNILSFLNPDSIPEEMFLGHESSTKQSKWQYWHDFR